MPRDYSTPVIDLELPASSASSVRRAVSEATAAAAAELLSEAKFPVILNGAGVVRAAPSGLHRAGRTARRAGFVGYQHVFPAPLPPVAGPLGYNGSKAAMELISGADVGWRSAPARPFRPFRAMASTIGRRRRRSSRWTSTPTASASPRRWRWASWAMPGRWPRAPGYPRQARAIGWRAGPRGAQEPDRRHEIALGAAALLHGP